MTQRRHIKFLEKVNFNQETRHLMTAHEPSLEKLQAMYAEFQKKESTYRSKNIQFETELELRGVE